MGLNNTMDKNNDKIISKEGRNKMSYVLIILYLVLTVMGLILYKKGTNSDFLFTIVNGSLNIKLSLISLLGLICYIGSFLLYMFILPKYNLTYIMPLMSAFSSISIYVLSILILGESITTNGIIGFLIILIGVFILNK